jgi:hypothetical protein
VVQRWVTARHGFRRNHTVLRALPITPYKGLLRSGASPYQVRVAASTLLPTLHIGLGCFEYLGTLPTRNGLQGVVLLN